MQHSNKKAFTLAEVLITLGIIGVVAAITMPSIIQNYQKKQTVERLKKSYSTISQALTRSVSDNGDFSEWGLGPEETDNSAIRDRTSKILNTYIIPYLKLTKDCGFTECRTSPDGIHQDGSTLGFGSRTYGSYLIYLADGTRVMFFIDHSTNSSGVNIYQNLRMYIDINGDSKPNKLGRDIFGLSLEPSTQKVNLWGNSDRNQNLYNCEIRGNYCGKLIEQDSWQIKSDYPW